MVVIDTKKGRDWDEMASTLAAGSTVGMGIGYFWRGPKAIIPGILTYSLIAGFGQAVYTRLRHYRQTLALEHSIAPPEEPFRFRELLKTKSMESNYGEIDPIQMLMGWVRDTMASVVDLPSWASPLVNALDLEYRNRLNYKIAFLEQQIGELSPQKDDSVPKSSN